MAVANYATTTDLATYLADVSTTQNSTIWTTFLSMASRFLDTQLGQYFYDDGQYVRWFDGIGTSHFTTYEHPFFGSSGTIASCAQGATSLAYTASQLAPAAPQNGDLLTLDVIGSLLEVVTINGAVTGTFPNFTLPITATAHAHAAATVATTVAVQLAYFENQPVAQWVTKLSGDGVNPPSNFFLWPRNVGRIGSAAETTQIARKPWTGMDISHIPISNTNYLPSSIPGYMTVGVTAHWGWPVVPDLIKDMTCKLAARAWRAREAGWSEVLGTTETGIVHMSRFFDPMDEALLLQSDLKLIAF